MRQPRSKQANVLATLGSILLIALLEGCAMASSAQTPPPWWQSREVSPTITHPSAFNPAPMTPAAIAATYDLTSLYASALWGQGQTVVVLAAYGSPTLALDLAAFDAHYRLPPASVETLTPLGAVPAYDPNNQVMQGWADTVTSEVEAIHALAPAAHIAVLASPVEQAEGISGLPQLLQMARYAVSNHLGSVILLGFTVSEATLATSVGHDELAQWDAFLQAATMQDHVTFVAPSGDDGATDAGSEQLIPAGLLGAGSFPISTTPTTTFPASSPWVTGVGGTTLHGSGPTAPESVWETPPGVSGGGLSRFAAEPAFQRALPVATQRLLAGRRGVPDIAANASWGANLGVYRDGAWYVLGGTEIAAAYWSAIVTLANQQAGHALGWINPALYHVATSADYTQAFRDVTSGDNSYPGGPDSAQQAQSVYVKGYPATVGWDPATGWGTPECAKLLPRLIAASA